LVVALVIFRLVQMFYGYRLFRILVCVCRRLQAVEECGKWETAFSAQRAEKGQNDLFQHPVSRPEGSGS
jgi:hypothetical protein